MNRAELLARFPNASADFLRDNAQDAAPVRHGGTVDRESKLHEQIMDYCRDHGLYYVHSRMDQKTTTAVGVPDFIIANYDGKTLWLECKAKGGKPTMQQLATVTFLKKLGHTAEVIYSLDEFVKLLGQ